MSPPLLVPGSPSLLSCGHLLRSRKSCGILRIDIPSCTPGSSPDILYLHARATLARVMLWLCQDTLECFHGFIPAAACPERPGQKCVPEIGPNDEDDVLPGISDVKKPTTRACISCSTPLGLAGPAWPAPLPVA